MSTSDFEYLTLQEAVARGYAAYSTLRKYIGNGRLPAVKIGGRVKVRPNDLDALAITIGPAARSDLDQAVDRIVAASSALTTTHRRRLAGIVVPEAVSA